MNDKAMDTLKNHLPSLMMIESERNRQTDDHNRGMILRVRSAIESVIHYEAKGDPWVLLYSWTPRTQQNDIGFVALGR